MASSCDVVIVGAGPYGLSLGAHLASRGVSFRIFGRPMHAWRTQMPEGMLLKSEGFASSLNAPGKGYPLRSFCSEHGLPYQEIGLPVPIETFIAYGVEFQRRYVPSLEQRDVTLIEPRANGFAIQLDDGEQVVAPRVVVGIGVRPFAHVPEELAALPAGMVTHSSDHHALDHLVGKDVAVVGAGASAVDLATLLNRAGARPHLVSRSARIDFHEPPREMNFLERMQEPRSGLGTGWRSWLCAELPLVFHRMPEPFRLRVVRRHLGPAPGWYRRKDFEGKIPTTYSAVVRSAAVRDGRVVLMVDAAGEEREVVADHVIAGTGYRTDLRRVSFLSPALLERVRMLGHTPVLSSRFETSLPGLFFMGPAAATSFGPVMRFACGSAFAARRIAPYLAAQAKRAARSSAGTRPGAKTEESAAFS